MTGTGEQDWPREAQRMLGAADAAFEAALAAARRVTREGREIDAHQVLTVRIASLATELRAAHELLAHARRVAGAGADEPLARPTALAFAAETAQRTRFELDALQDELRLEPQALKLLAQPGIGQAGRAALASQAIALIGAQVIESRGANLSWLEDEAAVMARAAVRSFARAEVAPLAEQIHRDDQLVPDDLIEQMASLGLFAASIPEAYGGSGLGLPIMVITTEELSAASLGAAGSLSTRPEILARALLLGGSEAQRRFWLPRIASGELMVAVAVTEPDAGSDVSSLSTRAESVAAGAQGYIINGAKAWSTFAGRADVIAVLARTNADPGAGARGLSLFIVPKQRQYGRRFDERQPGGGRLHGDAIRTPGYRGMHSFLLTFDDFFVPAENLVGEAQGRDRGFYLQMSGFAAGRLQTGGRAVGVAQAALEQTAAYAEQRRQFGHPIGAYQLTQYRLGQIATRLAAARQLTYAAARAMQSDARDADLLAAMAKLFACDVAVWATQEGQILHGGWGYAEETPISRHVVDALVLPIFEGTRPILALKVIGQGLLRGTDHRSVRPRGTEASLGREDES